MKVQDAAHSVGQEVLLQGRAATSGSLCPGLVLSARAAMVGLGMFLGRGWVLPRAWYTAAVETTPGKGD